MMNFLPLIAMCISSGYVCCQCEGQPETDPMLSALGEYAGGPGQLRKPAG